MASLNRVLLIGRLTRDPQLRYTPSGVPVADIGLAVNRYTTGQDGQRKEQTAFIDIVLWRRQAEVASEYLSKGREVFIEGYLQFDQWENNEGQKRSKLRVVGERLQFLGPRGDSPAPGGAPAPAPARAAEASAESDFPPEPPAGAPDDEIPF